MVKVSNYVEAGAGLYGQHVTVVKLSEVQILENLQNMLTDTYCTHTLRLLNGWGVSAEGAYSHEVGPWI